jgi:hypothetical protein
MALIMESLLAIATGSGSGSSAFNSASAQTDGKKPFAFGQ